MGTYGFRIWNKDYSIKGCQGVLISIELNVLLFQVKRKVITSIQKRHSNKCCFIQVSMWESVNKWMILIVDVREPEAPIYCHSQELLNHFNQNIELYSSFFFSTGSSEIIFKINIKNVFRRMRYKNM